MKVPIIGKAIIKMSTIPTPQVIIKALDPIINNSANTLINRNKSPLLFFRIILFLLLSFQPTVASPTLARLPTKVSADCGLLQVWRGWECGIGVAPMGGCAFVSGFIALSLLLPLLSKPVNDFS